MAAEIDDAVLMSRYSNGDASAFDILYARHKASLFRYLAHRCRPRSAAADVFQEVWSRVIAHRERYEVRAAFKTYLFRIAHHCAVDHHRARSRKRDDRMEAIEDHDEALTAASHEQPDAQAAHLQVEDLFRRALSELPEEQREVFVLFEESGLGLLEIAEITSTPAETVKSRLRYAVAKLRRALGDDLKDAPAEAARVHT